MTRILGVALGLAVGLMGTAAVASDGEYTVGDFAVRLAQMMTDELDYDTPEAAVAVLGQIGVDLKGDLQGEVTEEYVIDVFNRQLGTDLTTSNPGRTVDRRAADRIFGLLDPLGNPALERQGIGKCKGKPPNTASHGFKCQTDADCVGEFGQGFCFFGGKRVKASPNEP